MEPSNTTKTPSSHQTSLYSISQAMRRNKVLSTTQSSRVIKVSNSTLLQMKAPSATYSYYAYNQEALRGSAMNQALLKIDPYSSIKN